jgi:hypothetical protein
LFCECAGKLAAASNVPNTAGAKKDLKVIGSAHSHRHSKPPDA